jgi:chromosome segregation ATPase
MDNFNVFPVDRLRFEYEKRERELSRLQMELSDLKREEAQINNDWEEASSQLVTSADYRNFDAGGFQSGLQHISNQKSDVYGRMKELEAEMKAIEQALNAKWK